MALVNKLPSLSSSSPKFKKPSSFKLNPVRSIHYKSNSPSPFTEKHSIERYKRDNWVYNSQLEQPHSFPVESDSGSIREHEIEAQLPELKRLLEVLREKRESSGGGERGRGPGNVFLVGTGPGDPELLTVKAVRVIRCADLLLYDRLVSNEVLDLVGHDARLLYVGRLLGTIAEPRSVYAFMGISLYEEIHELLLSFAEAGANVVRLKGGDPLVFGRGGEEMDFLQQQGIQVQVIPGITAASGIAAELRIPLTHRGVANSVFAELKDLPDKITQAQLVSPTLIIVGKVVALSPFWAQSSKEASSLVEVR
ncbi:urophorphyrin methylase 1 [Actinidia rufa]|uniref:uroporphyrinogen-III C-methyltransferase n=1 Tax=Actinidia rufa TaxID=165716 RepID=A0A7J0FVR1_9ERIC|nr:urophorphyrin methylase 1 [Actinidia rufa]